MNALTKKIVKVAVAAAAAAAATWIAKRYLDRRKDKKEKKD